MDEYLGQALLRQERYRAAELTLRRAFDRFDAQLGRDNPRTQAAARALLSFYAIVRVDSGAARFAAMIPPDSARAVRERARALQRERER